MGACAEGGTVTWSKVPNRDLILGFGVNRRNGDAMLLLINCGDCNLHSIDLVQTESRDHILVITMR